MELQIEDAALHVGARLRVIPDTYRTYTLTAQELTGRYGLGEQHVRLLDEHDLHRAGPGGARYDEMDALNVAVHLNVGNAASMLRRLLPRYLRRARPGRFQVSAVLACPEPGHPGPCDYTMQTADGLREVRRDDREPVSFDSTAAVGDAPADIPAPVREIARRISGYDFFLLPYGLKDDVEFVRRTGVADCVGTTRLFIEEVQAIGLPARARYGLLLAPPFATYHRFPEVRLDGRWVPFDPLLLGALARWGAVSELDWPPDRAISPAVVPVGEAIPASTHNGEWIMPSFPLRRLPD